MIRFVDVMRHTIALNGSFFNTQRMLSWFYLQSRLRMDFNSLRRALFASG
jgi:hypothetical protein